MDVLIGVLRGDADARVREMSAWALGSIDSRTAGVGLIGALRRDSSDPEVREAAVCGLAGSDSFNPWPWPRPRPTP